MPKNLRSLVVLVAATLLLGAPSALARTVPAISHQPSYDFLFNSRFTCWVAGWGAMTNRCSTTRFLDIPLSVDNPGGGKQVIVNVIAPNRNADVDCTVFSANADGSGHHRSPARSAPSFGAASQIVFPGVSAASGGTFLVSCAVDPGASVISVQYDH